MVTVGASGSFVLPTKLASGASYSVSVGTQPGNPAQTCAVQNGTGTVGSLDVTTIIVACTKLPSTYAYATVPHSAGDASVGRLEYFSFDDGTGRLTLQGSSVAPTDTAFFYVRAAPSGRQLLVSTNMVLDRVLNSSRDDLTLYDLSAATGAPSRSTQVASPGGGDLILHPNGLDLYTAGAMIRHYSLAPGAAQGQSLNIGLQPGLASAITPDGRFLFVPNSGQDNDFVPFIAAVSLADPSRPQLVLKVPTSIRPLTATISSDGRQLYVTPIDTNAPGQSFRVDSSGGLTQSGTFAAPSYARSVVVTPSGSFLYMASTSDNMVQGYRLDGAGGVTPLGIGTPVPSAFRLVLGPNGRYLYALSSPVDGKPGAIYGYAIGVDGSLTPVPGSPLLTGEREYDLAFAIPNP